MTTETTAGPMIEWVRREGRPNEGGDRTYFPTSVIFEKARWQDDLHAEMLVALKLAAEHMESLARHLPSASDIAALEGRARDCRALIAKAKEAR